MSSTGDAAASAERPNVGAVSLTKLPHHIDELFKADRLISRLGIGGVALRQSLLFSLHTALLDPESASDYDVSSSDLSASFSRGPSAATRVLSVELDGAPATDDSDTDITEPDAFEMPAGAYRGRAPESDPFARDVFERDAFDSEPVMMGEPLAGEEESALEPAPAPFIAEPVPASAPFVARPVAEDPF